MTTAEKPKRGPVKFYCPLCPYIASAIGAEAAYEAHQDHQAHVHDSAHPPAPETA